MSEQNRSGIIATAAVTLMRAENVADKEVWRDRPQIAHDETDPFSHAVVVRIGASTITQIYNTLVDVDLSLDIECIARGRPSAATGSDDTASTRVENLCRAVTRVMQGNTLAGTINLGLTYVFDIDEIGSSEMSMEEKGEWSLGSVTMLWIVKYRRLRVDPGN